MGDRDVCGPPLVCQYPVEVRGLICPVVVLCRGLMCVGGVGSTQGRFQPRQTVWLRECVPVKVIS